MLYRQGLCLGKIFLLSKPRYLNYYLLRCHRPFSVRCFEMGVAVELKFESMKYWRFQQ